MRNFRITKYGAGGCKPHENGRYVLISDVIDKLDLMLDNEYNTLTCVKLFKKVLTCSPKESCEVNEEKLTKFVSEQTPLPKEFEAVLNDNFWDLL